MAKPFSFQQTFFIATLLAVVCSLLVSVSVVLLKDRQQNNLLIFKRSNVLAAGGINVPSKDVNATFAEKIVVKFMDFNTQSYVEAPTDPTFDSVAAARHPDFTENIPARDDVARIKRRSNISEIYLLKDQNNQITTVILPVRGKGLWSTMLGFLALDAQSLDVQGLSFYGHGETPGLGGEIDNPAWKQQWQGKKIYGEDGAVALRVLKGRVLPDDPKRPYHVDGLAGATLTARGVSQMIAYWLGTSGYKDFLTEQRSKGWPLEGPASPSP